MTDRTLRARSGLSRRRSRWGSATTPASRVGDLIEFPSVPSINLRVVHWANDNWGIAGQVLGGRGSFDPGERAVEERRDPVYAHVMARFRTVGDGMTSFHAGIGGGVSRVGETPRFDPGILGERPDSRWFPNLLVLEGLGPQQITERFSVRVGITMVVPVHLQPVVLAAYRF